MNKKRIEKFNVLNADYLATVEGGAAPGWYNVAWWSPNLECRNGYAYTSENMKSGNCRWRYDIMVQNVINQTISGAVSGLVHGVNYLRP